MDLGQQAGRQGKELTVGAKPAAAAVRGLHSLTRLDLRLTHATWGFAEAHRRRIDSHWSTLRAAMPAIWNGPVLMARDVRLESGRLTAEFVKSDYAGFIAWRDWGCPDTSVHNCFGSAVIRSVDGAVIFGRMARHTLNAGLCYPPGGSLDLDDVRPDGSVDMLGSIAREIKEETGLAADAAQPEELWAVFDGQRISVAQLLTFDATADGLLRRIRAHIAAEPTSELADAVVLRRRSDTCHTMPGYARQLVLHLLAD